MHTTKAYRNREVEVHSFLTLAPTTFEQMANLTNMNGNNYGTTTINYTCSPLYRHERGVSIRVIMNDTQGNSEGKILQDKIQACTHTA